MQSLPHHLVGLHHPPLAPTYHCSLLQWLMGWKSNDQDAATDQDMERFGSDEYRGTSLAQQQQQQDPPCTAGSLPGSLSLTNPTTRACIRSMQAGVLLETQSKQEAV